MPCGLKILVRGCIGKNIFTFKEEKVRSHWSPLPPVSIVIFLRPFAVIIMGDGHEVISNNRGAVIILNTACIVVHSLSG